MDDETIKKAFLAIADHCSLTLDAHLNLVEMIAKKFPGFSSSDREQLLIAAESDKKRLNVLKEILQHLD